MNEHFWKSLVDSIHEGVYFVDPENTITYWNKGAELLTGYSAHDVVGSKCSDNILQHVDESGHELCKNDCPLQATMKDGIHRDCEVFLHHKKGHRIPVSVRSSPVYEDDNKTIAGCVEVFSFNDKEQKICEAIHLLGDDRYVDHLTRIANRRHGDLVLEAHLQGTCQHQTRFALLMVDIDSFKAVNDKYGHGVGDLAIQMVVKSLTGGLRPLDFICRWGGEEFVIIIPGVTQKRLSTIAERLRMLVERNWIDVDGAHLKATISIGGTISVNMDTAESIINRADKQLYQSKHLGKNLVCLG